MKIDSGKTAIKRNKPSAPLRKFLKALPYIWIKLNGDFFIQERRGWRALDHGCGRGDDIEYLESLDSWSLVDGYDPVHRPKAFKEHSKYDVVLSTYVLNTISSVSERYNILAKLGELTVPRGIVSVATRSYRGVNKSKTEYWAKHKDGWLTSAGTFQRPFSSPQLAEMLMNAGFNTVFNVAETSDFSLVVAAEYKPRR